MIWNLLKKSRPNRNSKVVVFHTFWPKLKNIKKSLKGPWKVLEFCIWKIVGTTTWASTCALEQIRTCASSCALTHLSKYLRTFVLAHVRTYASSCALKTLTHCVFLLLNRHVFVFQMEAHSVSPVNTLTWLSVGVKLYHCLRLSAMQAQ